MSKIVVRGEVNYIDNFDMHDRKTIPSKIHLTVPKDVLTSMYGVPTRWCQYVMVDRRYDSGVWGDVMRMISDDLHWYDDGVIPVDIYLITPRPITITNFHIEDEYTIVHKVVPW